MARPRIFVSSTYYDLKHLRSSLENFLSSLGFDTVLSEKGQIAYSPDMPLDESCYREVGNADIFVLIIGGRYGSEASQTKRRDSPRTFFERYDSVTRGEYQSAIKRDVPMYILVEKGVYAEYQTFLKNKGNESIRYAHVDSINIFALIEDILAQARNNPVFQFERYAEIEIWLREQWAGLFRELLQRNQNQRQLATLQGQVGRLEELNATFKTYLEEIVSTVSPREESKKLISRETTRLRNAEVDRKIQENPLGHHLVGTLHIPIADVRKAFLSANWDEMEITLQTAAKRQGDDEVISRIQSLFQEGMHKIVLEDVQLIRKALGLPDFLPDSEPNHRVDDNNLKVTQLAVTKLRQNRKRKSPVDN